MIPNKWVNTLIATAKAIFARLALPPQIWAKKSGMEEIYTHTQKAKAYLNYLYEIIVYREIPFISWHHFFPPSFTVAVLTTMMKTAKLMSSILTIV